MMAGNETYCEDHFACIQILSHYVMYLNLIICHMSNILQLKRKNNSLTSWSIWKRNTLPLCVPVSERVQRVAIEGLPEKKVQMIQGWDKLPPRFYGGWWERGFLQELEPGAFLPDSSEATGRVWLENHLKVYRHGPDSLRSILDLNKARWFGK